MPTQFKLRCDRTTFDLQNALAMAQVSELIYRPADDVASVFCSQWGFDEFEFFDVDDTQCLVAADEESIIVAFRGTEPNCLGDWITDAQVELVPGPLGGRVHVGFYEALSDVWRQVELRVRELDPWQKKPLWVTGHSLGAALATLAVARWLDAGRPVAGMYTFGQPRTGDRQFARNFNFAYKPHAFRFVNNDDLVTRAPPRAFGYSHLGTFKYFDGDGQFQQGIKWWNVFLDRWQGRLERIFLGADDGENDHSMRIYRERIAAASQSPAAISRAAAVSAESTQPLAAPRQLTMPRRRAA